MCDVPGDYLLTYDPAYTELHSDSSDFDEDSLNSPVSHTIGNHSLLKKKLYSKSKRDIIIPQICNSRAYTVTDASSREIWESQTIISQYGREIDLEVRQSYQNRKSKILDSGDQIETIKSKRSLIRHKVIPCISSMFGRSSNNVKQMSIIKENQAEHVNIDNGCQANCEHRMRTCKSNRRQQCYAVQPVYAGEENIHAKSSPFQHTKVVREPLSTYKMVGNENSRATYSLTSSSEGIEPPRYSHRKKWRNKKSKHFVEPDMEEEYMRHYEGPNLKERQQQCPSRQTRKIPYQVFTTPYAYQRTSTGCSPIASNKVSGSELPSTCSGFWDFLISKINMKYQAQANCIIRPCRCNNSSATSSHCTPRTCENIGTQPEPQDSINKSNPIPPMESCACNTAPMHGNPLNLNDNMEQSSPMSMPPSKIRGKVECNCFPDKKSLTRPSPKRSPAQLPPQLPPPLPEPPSEPGPSLTPSPRKLPVCEDETRPCQLPHDDITATLSKKYNREILCIHNPPCVLINGCLNLPPPKGEPSTDMWAVQTEGRNGYHNLYSKCTQRQQSVQYGPPSLDMHQCGILDESCQYFPPVNEMQKLSINNESCQYQNPSIEMKQLMITDDSCQFRLSPVATQNKQFTDNESCQYSLSPIEMQKLQVTANESCQYLPPLIDVQQLRTPQPKQEKIIQSICNHSPPCEVVRTCIKPKFDPKLQNSCVHVPMCQKVPICLMELKNQNDTKKSCQHKPKCTEVPICTRNFIVLTAKEEAATQVRPKAKMVCRHEPPCIMIPKCLARVCDSYIPYDAIPDCIHQPMCEMIPACCRKSAKEMVSVCSQYPNQCCIV